MTGFDEVGGVGGGAGGNCDDGGESVVAFLCGAALVPNPTSIVTTVAGRVATVVGVGAGRAAAAVVGLVATAMGVVAAVGLVGGVPVVACSGGGDGVEHGF